MKWWKSKKRELEKIFEQYAGAMSLYACSFVRDFQMAEDIVQEIFVNLLNNNQVPQKPKSYLMQAVRNRAFNCQRSPSLKSLDDCTNVWFNQPLEKKEQREKLTFALSCLPQEQREVIVLKIWGQLTFKEIAETVHLSPNTTASRYQYGIKHLREIMTKEFNDDRRL
ncbi:RNA polymerase sigma factor [Candidatus Uabimicrobium sp. HlEnr_7]|uniref:RNA polymerase sigma factor n=1 Tax=Candidatus Uabimicrobium helgolandensis TaxID=3095367 RepID=UPI003557CF94